MLEEPSVDVSEVVRHCLETYNPPRRNMPVMATFCETMIFSFHINGIGNTSRKTSVAMLGIATPRKYWIELMHVDWIFFSQNPWTGIQENMPAKS